MANSTPITLDSRIVATADPIAAEMDDELILLGLAQGAYYGLADTARYIWQQIDQPRRVGDLCAQLTQIFDVDAEDCARQVCTFLESLRAEGLIQIVPPGAAAPPGRP